jgi:hypothetical protein
VRAVCSASTAARLRADSWALSIAVWWRLGVFREQVNRIVLDFVSRRDSLEVRKAISFWSD